MVVSGVGEMSRLGSLSDLAQLERVTRRTAMVVINSFSRAWRTLTQDELRSMVMLMPDDTGWATASPGRCANTGGRLLRQAHFPQIQEQIVVQDAVGTPVADVPVIMQLEFQQSCQFLVLKVPQILSPQR